MPITTPPSAAARVASSSAKRVLSPLLETGGALAISAEQWHAPPRHTPFRCERFFWQMPGAPGTKPLDHCPGFGFDRHLPVAAGVLQELLEQLQSAGSVIRC